LLNEILPLKCIYRSFATATASSSFSVCVKFCLNATTKPIVIFCNRNYFVINLNYDKQEFILEVEVEVDVH